MRYLKTFEGSSAALLVTLIKNGDYAYLKKILSWRENYIDVNEKDNMGWTPLLWATYYEDKKMIKLLIDVGADMNYKALHHIGGTKSMVDFYDLSVDKGYTKLTKWIEKNYPVFVATKKYNL